MFFPAQFCCQIYLYIYQYIGGCALLLPYSYITHSGDYTIYASQIYNMYTGDYRIYL